jgi:peroxiredoxin
MRWWIAGVAAAAVFAIWAHGHTYAGKTAPDFSLTTVDGQTAKLSDERGKVVLIDFWATWCPPCRASLPHLQDAYNNESWANRGLVVWAVNAHESADDVSNFLARNQYTFTALLDSDGAAMSAYGVSGIPMTVIVGRDGVVKKVLVGYEPDSGREVDEAIEKALADSAS